MNPTKFKMKKVEYLKGNCFLHHITAPNHREKAENTLKKWGTYKITFWTFFSGTQ